MLSEELNCKWSFRLPSNRETLIINWGTRHDFSGYPNVWNRYLVNKYNAFRKFRENNVKCPKFWENYDDIFKEGLFPVLGRKFCHKQGNDIIYIGGCESYEEDAKECDFFVELKDKKDEYRVHVVKGNVVTVCKKVPREGMEQDDMIRSFKRGWKHITYNPNGYMQRPLRELAVKAVEAIEYDFGAVDIIVDNDNVPWVLEVNSAPSLEEIRIKQYAEKILEVS